MNLYKALVTNIFLFQNSFTKCTILQISMSLNDFNYNNDFITKVCFFLLSSCPIFFLLSSRKSKLYLLCLKLSFETLITISTYGFRELRHDVIFFFIPKTFNQFVQELFKMFCIKITVYYKTFLINHLLTCCCQM